MAFELPSLPYEFNALEPYMDSKTVEIHYTKHHKGYADKLNKTLEKYPELFEKTPEKLLININEIPDEIKTKVRNFGGGVVNHNIFWKVMCPANKSGECSGEILNKINENFVSFTEFKKQFTEKATTLFGSGYCWLVVNQEGNLEIMTTKDQDSPLSIGKKPILVIDVWEHAYYLKYQNRRPDFIEAFWSLINWDKVDELLKE
jgi:superoxide dismutase, Fe-Mn family